MWIKSSNLIACFSVGCAKAAGKPHKSVAPRKPLRKIGRFIAFVSFTCGGKRLQSAGRWIMSRFASESKKTHAYLPFGGRHANQAPAACAPLPVPQSFESATAGAFIL